MKPKVYVISLGCPKNTIDTERLLGRLALGGAVICADAADADVIIVTTCSFIDAAREESVGVIREAVEAKRRGAVRGVIVAGCMVEHFKGELERMLPEVDAFVGFGMYNRMPDIVRTVAKGMFGGLNVKSPQAALGPEGERLRVTPLHYAYLRISEGCDNRCAYCMIPTIRGPLRSKPAGSVLKEARELADHGVKELILVAEDTTAWGFDLKGKPRLASLISRLEKIEGIEWIRLMYAYPSHVDDELISMFGGRGKLIPYLDLPIQHLSTPVLRRMGRKYTETELRRMIEKLRNANGMMVLRTSLIAGFPGETEKDFRKLADFISEGHFQRVGCFAYSREEGTPSAEMKNQVPAAVAAERAGELMERAAEKLIEFHGSLVGKEVPVVIEGSIEGNGRECIGRTWADAPEIDPVIRLTGGKCIPGRICNAEVEGVNGYDLEGKLV